MQGPFLRKYGEAATINFHLFQIDGIDLRTDATVGTADLDVMRDEATEAAATNAATDEGQGYSLVLTAAEMTAQRITIYVVDAATKVWLDEVLIVETIRHPSAQHPQGVTEAGTAQAGGNSTITLRSGASSVNDFYRGQRVYLTGATGAGQSRPVIGYAGSTRIVTISASGTWATNPNSTTQYELLPDSLAEITIPSAADNADAVLDELTAGHVIAGSLAVAVTDTLNDTAQMRFSTAGNLDSNVMEVNDNGGLTGDGVTPIRKA